jgi:hypothetical protein
MEKEEYLIRATKALARFELLRTNTKDLYAIALYGMTYDEREPCMSLISNPGVITMTPILHVISNTRGERTWGTIHLDSSGESYYVNYSYGLGQTYWGIDRVSSLLALSSASKVNELCISWLENYIKNFKDVFQEPNRFSIPSTRGNLFSSAFSSATEYTSTQPRPSTDSEFTERTLAYEHEPDENPFEEFDREDTDEEEPEQE